MTAIESERLIRAYNYQKTHRGHYNTIPSRRSTKGKGQGVGAILKNTRIIVGVGLETVFNHPDWPRP